MARRTNMGIRGHWAVLVGAWPLLWGTVAMAQEPAPGPALRTVSLTFAPALLVHPVAQISAELRIHRHAGVSLIGGFGQVDAEHKTSGGDVTTTGRKVWVVGGQARYYALGHFDHGLELGLEALYTGVTGSEPMGTIVLSRAGDGLSAGPFIGYKITTLLGLTFEGQLGIKRAGIAGSDSETSQWVPLLNGNVGWSF